MSSSSQASELLKSYMTTTPNGRMVLRVPDGKYKGWLPKSLYTLELDELYLPFMRLSNFPVRGSSLGNLTSLKVFHAVGNYLQCVPSSFGQITNLQRLNLSYNNLSELSPSLFELTNLVELNLSENCIEMIPPEIGELKNLRHLNLGGNLLSEVPDAMGQCKKLQVLNLSGKWSPRGGLRMLPKPVCNLTELLTLDCSWHQIDTLPDEIGNLQKLKVLSLRGNHLKYVSQDIAKCGNLQELNLTAAMRFIPAIPLALLSLKRLVKLNISGNYFTQIPPEVSGLENLKVFLMQKNALLQLPEEFFQLQQLEEIELSDNYLESISSNVKRLHVLRLLSMCNNRLKCLPNDIGKCQSLQSLNLSYNQLTELPDTIYQLANLDYLNLTHNQLKRLPLLLDRLTGLERTKALFLGDNYLTRPPQEICNQGVDALFNFLKEIRVSEASHRKKMILTGAVKAGKTSLRNALLLGHSQLTAEDERTWVLERHLWEPEESLRVQILDFGGHHIYSAAHHMFLTPEALHILVFDLSVFSMDHESYDYRIGDWLEGIMDRAPGASILLVGTHADLCSEEEIKEKKDYILERMHSDENTKINNLQYELHQLQSSLDTTQSKESGVSGFSDIDVERAREKVIHLQRMLNTRVTLPDNIQVVSCAEDLVGIDELTDTLMNTLKKNDPRPLPKSWYKFLMAIQRREEKILDWSQALDIFVQLMDNLGQSMISLEGSAKESLKVILKYLHATGEIVWYHDNPRLDQLVFHRPETLVDMLRAIFRHDFEDVMVYNISIGFKINMSEEMFSSAKKLFLEQGMMSTELLRYTLCHFNLGINALDTFTSLMLKFDLCYEIPINQYNPSLLAFKQLLLFPWFLPDVAPTDLSLKWPARVPKDTVQLSIQLQFPNKGPPNFFEKITVRLQNYVAYRDGWRNGIFAVYNMSKVLLQKERKDVNNQLMLLVTLSVRGSDLQEIWSLIQNPWQDMLSLLREWPFARIETKLLCSHCIMTGREEPFQFPGKVLEIRCPKGCYYLQCPSTKEVCQIPACFVYSLDPDFQDDLPKHIQATINFMQRCDILLRPDDDTVDGTSGDTGLLSDIGLRYLAAKLGIDWFCVGLQLGLPVEEIERIQMDNPSNSFRQIFTVLKRWRDRERANPSKVKQLITALEHNDLNKIVADLKEKYEIDTS